MTVLLPFKKPRDALRERVNGENQVFPDTFYTTEVLNITVEYIQQLGDKIKVATNK